jgi:hypothetical protein
MSWTADQIYTLPKLEVINFFKEIPYFEKRLFLVTDLDGVRSEWTKELLNSEDSRRHTLPDGGLLVIAPHVYSTGYDKDRDTHTFWTDVSDKDQDSEKWSEIKNEYPETVDIPANLTVTESQIRLFSLLKSVNKQTSVPFCYYKCEMWGGDTFEEFSIIFKDGITIFVNDIENDKTLELKSDSQNIIDNTPLQLGLESLGLNLPTWFFALHEGSFNWRQYQIK